MASPHLTTPPSHDPTSRINPPHLLNVLTSSATLQSHLGLNNPIPYVLPPLPLPPALPILKPSNLGLYARLQTRALLLPESRSTRTSTTTSVRALTFTDITSSMQNPEVRRNVLLKRCVVGEEGVREMRVGSVSVGKGEGEGGKWVFVIVVWEREEKSGARGGKGRKGRRMCFALPERGVERLEGWGSGGGEEVEGTDMTEIASFSTLFSRGGIPVFEFADLDVDESEGPDGVEAEGEGEDAAEGEDAREDEEEGEAEAGGQGEGMDGVQAEVEQEEDGEEDGEQEGEVEGEVDGEGDGGAGTEGDGDGEEEEEWISVKRAMGRGSCLVRFYV